MILHCVFLRLKMAVTSDEKQALFDAIVALKQVIPGILDIKYGPNVSPEGLHGGFVDGFAVTFESAEARDAISSIPNMWPSASASSRRRTGVSPASWSSTSMCEGGGAVLS